MRRDWHRGIAGAALAGLLATAGTALAGCTPGDSGTGAANQAPATAPPVAGGSGTVGVQQAFESVVQHVLPSVVEIRTGSGLGSGVVFDKQGHIVTNAHVVGNAENFRVILPTSNTALTGTLVAKYTAGDLAVIKVPANSGVKPARFGDSSTVRVGQLVLAMGNPLGLSASVTNGIISAKSRTVSEPQGQGSPGATIPDAIQTSAAINPGNSGGALVDMDGQVIGIPTLAATAPELGGVAPGIGFAIPSDTVVSIATQIIEQGKVTRSGRAALGITARTVLGPDLKPAGAGVVEVQPGGAADHAGITPGDVIVAINGTPTPTIAALQKLLATLEPGQQATVALMREGGGTTTVKVTLGELH